ncbi:carboxylesterase family protein [Actinoplanes sp. NPDC026619]|uniref:carboxylesterase/lipase family protein n=1 Tax=Actinoplanes sp. NPDC026619 TaxID=3155798 RepID=UPI0033F4E00F
MTIQASPPISARTITATTTEGPVRGLAHEGYRTFFAVPYAAAPIGDLRFAPPQPAVARDGELDATVMGAVCEQDLDPLPFNVPPTQHNFFHPAATPSEDSLTLNIWTPDVEGTAPVLFWIHGGAFLYGSGTGSWTDGARHAREHGVVVVSINYRLGILGGLYLADKRDGWANVALQDQIQALRWVRENIASFGGDPAGVTIAGQSAGAMSAAGILVSPAAEGLFRRAIVQSGHLGVTTSIDSAIAHRDTVLRQFGIDPAAEDAIEQLQQVNILRVLAVQRSHGVTLGTFPLVRDGQVIATDPLELLRSGARRDIDVLIGTNAEEDRLFSLTGWVDDDTSLADDLANVLSDPADVERALAIYGSIAETDDRGRRFLFATDHGWRVPALETALACAQGGGRVFTYEFAWKSTAMDGRVGAAHLVELPFTFGVIDAPGVGSLIGERSVTDPDVQAFARAVAIAWTNFIRGGDPAGSPLGDWTPFTAGKPSTMVIDLYPELVTDRNSVRLDFVRSAASKPPLTTIAD